MNPRRPEKTLPHPLIPPAAYDELCDFLRASGSALTPAEAIANAAPLRGYQWKQLFLPDATRVRMRHRDDWHSAAVVGDELNPKAFFFATVVFPPLAAGPGAMLHAYLIFSGLLIPIAALWIAMGAAVLAYPGATPRQPLVHRIASVVLFAFSGTIFASVLAKI